ncbi:MAG: hypothetical protein JST04_00800 [Bdellovibrionales bacterium]|nr:hypothetical protein [Bdellovibrionales bacterium]
MLQDNIVQEVVYNTPLVLLSFTAKDDIDKANNFLPYSTGFEIECDKGELYNEINFTSIPNILAVKNDSHEQRYRIPNGIIGLICLYNISIQLKINSTINNGSGIHYHIDCSNNFDEIRNEIFKNEKSILNELKSWEYKGKYNSWKISDSKTAVRVHSYHKTIEFRIGEMTFDYEILVKRIIHANDIVRRIKRSIGVPEPTYTFPDKSKILNYIRSIDLSNGGVKLRDLKARLEELKKSSDDIKPIQLEQATQLIKNRKIIV